MVLYPTEHNKASMGTKEWMVFVVSDYTDTRSLRSYTSLKPRRILSIWGFHQLFSFVVALDSTEKSTVECEPFHFVVLEELLLLSTTL